MNSNQPQRSRSRESDSKLLDGEIITGRFPAWSLDVTDDWGDGSVLELPASARPADLMEWLSTSEHVAQWWTWTSRQDNAAIVHFAICPHGSKDPDDYALAASFHNSDEESTFVFRFVTLHDLMVLLEATKRDGSPLGNA